MAIPQIMRAMVLRGLERPLELDHVAVPKPGPRQVLVKVRACGVCRTDLHIVDGQLPDPKLPLIPGHEIVGAVVGAGVGADRFPLGQRIGVPWLGHADGTCSYCRRGQENLCDHPVFTGYTMDGGYAQYAVADERFCFPIPAVYDDAEAAPLLCAGLIGYRCYRLTGEHVERLGLYGFGAAAHIIAQVAVHEGKSVYAFSKPGDVRSQEFARSLGAVWAGEATQRPPAPLDAAIIFAPVGALVVEALRATGKGAVVVCGGIHMSDIPSFAYRLLWEERVVRSVANLTRRDGEGLLAVAPRVPVRTKIHRFALEQANEALMQLREGRFEGAAVLVMSD